MPATICQKRDEMRLTHDPRSRPRTRAGYRLPASGFRPRTARLSATWSRRSQCPLRIVLLHCQRHGPRALEMVQLDAPGIRAGHQSGTGNRACYKGRLVELPRGGKVGVCRLIVAPQASYARSAAVAGWVRVAGTTRRHDPNGHPTQQDRPWSRVGDTSSNPGRECPIAAPDAMRAHPSRPPLGLLGRGPRPLPASITARGNESAPRADQESAQQPSLRSA